MWAYFALYFVGGYLMFATLYVTIGAFCESGREAQTLLGPVMILMSVPMIFMSQAVAAQLRKQRRPGSIVSISSISGMNTAPYHIAYGTAKAALVAATRTLAVELGLDNIRVNAVAPGVTATPASLTFVGEDPVRDQKAIAMGRRARPEEQAGAILFLLSDLSSYVTGQTILVDGGLNLKWPHLDADNTSLFMRDPSFREAIKR